MQIINWRKYSIAICLAHDAFKTSYKVCTWWAVWVARWRDRGGIVYTAWCL